MGQATEDDARLVRYLLGQLTPEEQALIEERYLADAEFDDELRAVERDLIDQYVRGELADPAAFEKRFLSSPSRRQKVEFARTFAKTRLPRRHAPGRAWLPVAAAVAIAVAAGLLAPGRRGQGPGPGPQPTRGTAPEASTVPAQPRFKVLVLEPTLTRDSAATPTVAVEGLDEVRLELHLEAADSPSYRAVIRTADGKEIWRQEGLKPQAAAGGVPTITLRLPASRLATEDYTVRLHGISAGGAADEAGSYTFRVRLR